jgi:hypothetical protein
MDMITNKDNKKCLILTSHHVVPIDEIFFGRYNESTNDFKSITTNIPNYLVHDVRVPKIQTCQLSQSHITINSEWYARIEFANDKLFAKTDVFFPFEINVDKLYFCIEKSADEYKLEKYPIANIISHRLIKHYLLLNEYLLMFKVYADIKYHIIMQFINVICWDLYN